MGGVAGIIGLVTLLVQLAEGLFGGKAKSGAEKKEMVVSSTLQVVNAVAQASTGGQKDTWVQIGQSIGPLVDAIAGLIYPSDQPDSFINRTTQSGG